MVWVTSGSIERISLLALALSHSWMLIDDTRRGQRSADTNRSRPLEFIRPASSSTLPFRRIKGKHIYQFH